MKYSKRIILYFSLFSVTLITCCILTFADEIHRHTFTELYTAAATCTEKGYTVFSCECGESYTGSYTNALGHIFSKDIVCYKKPTCVQKGEGGRYCLRCYAKTDIIYYNKTAHTPVYITDQATLKRNGEVRKECSVCKKLYSKKPIAKIAAVVLEKKIYVYDSKVKTPAVIVKDSNGKKLTKNEDYFLSYQKGRKKTGSYSVKVTFKGNYEGTKTLFFKIRPAAVKNISAYPSVSSCYLTWNSSKGADGYEIYIKNKSLRLIKNTDNPYCTVNKINGKKLKSGTDYVFVIKAYKKTDNGNIYSVSTSIKAATKPQKTIITKTKCTKEALNITTAKQNCHGYEILLSTNKSFSNPEKVSVKFRKSNLYTLKSIKSGKKYYIKMRAFVVSSGEKFYGYYSDVKKIRT